jgi:uncharacterized membrane protein
MAVEGNWRGGVEVVRTMNLSPARARTLPLALTRRIGTSVVLVVACVWTVGYARLALERHWNYGSARFDLGNMVQAVWNTAHGRFLETTLETGEQTSRLAVHVDPILALFAPAALVFPTPAVLIVGQAAALAVGALPILWLARRRLGSEGAALLLALTYLASPWIAWETQTDFHPVALAIPLYLYAIWFLDDRLYARFALVTALALLCGELMGLPLLFIGLWHAVSAQRWKVGALIAATGVAWTVVCLRVVVPAIGGGHSPFYQHFHEVGGSPSGLIHTTVSDPGTVVVALSTAADIRYLILLALPLLGLFVAAPLLAVAALPQLAVNMLSSAPAMTSVRDHYIAGVIPFLFAATVIGLARFTPRRRVMLASLVLETSVVLAIAFGPWPALALPEMAYQYRAHRQPGNREAALAAIDLVPSGAAIASTNAAGAHLSERRYYYSVPVRGRAEWVLIDRRDPWLPYDPSRPNVYGPLPERLAAFEQDLKRDPRWRVVFEHGDVVLYRHIAGRIVR